MGDTFIIMIADRNRNVRELLRRELESEGYQVRLAKDGRQVLRSINSDEPPDLLILDHMACSYQENESQIPPG